MNASLAKALVPRSKARVAGVVRLLGFAACLAGIASIATVVKAQAEGRRATVQLGRGLIELRELLGTQTELRINGNRVFAGGTHVALPFEIVLDRFEQHCVRRGWQFTEHEVASFSKSLKVSSALLGAVSLTSSRQRGTSEGAVACLLAPEHARGLSQLLERAQRFISSGDLAQVGDLRYVFARANAAGGSDLVTVWTEGHFDIKAFRDSSGDVPGTDLPALRRPEGARRTLDVELTNHQYGVKSYVMALAPASALDGYGRDLRRADWLEVDTGKDPPGELNRTFVKGGAALILSSREESGRTRVDVVQMGSRGFTDVDNIGNGLVSQ